MGRRNPPNPDKVKGTDFYVLFANHPADFRYTILINGGNNDIVRQRFCFHINLEGIYPEGLLSAEYPIPTHTDRISSRHLLREVTGLRNADFGFPEPPEQSDGDQYH